MRLLFYIFIFSQLFDYINVFAEKLKRENIESNAIKWEKIEENKSNQVIIILYHDGTVEKKFINR